MSEIAKDILVVMPASIAALLFLCTVASWGIKRKQD